MRQRPVDRILLITTFFLILIGIAMVFSASSTLGVRVGDPLHFAKRHLLFVFLGSVLLWAGWRVDLPWLRRSAWTWYGFSVIGLLLLFLPGVGRTVGGAVRWIDLGLISFQPSEFSKLGLVILLAAWFSRAEEHERDARKLALPIICVSFLLLLLLKQPDMGTAIILLATTFGLLWVAGVPLRWMGSLTLLGILGMIILSVMAPYRLRRLMAFVNPWADPQGIGFHVVQSLLAVGSGGLWGAGLGAGRQKFFYIPQHSSDFIFAVLGEELGLIGSVAVIVLFTILVARGIRIARLCANPFERLLAVGLTSFMGAQAFLNIGVVLGVLPTTGIPLPFISYGGTALWTNLFAVGVLLQLSQTVSAKA